VREIDDYINRFSARLQIAVDRKGQGGDMLLIKSGDHLSVGVGGNNLLQGSAHRTGDAAE
jgi:hypothetical protein